MRKIVEYFKYFKSLFCKHEFELIKEVAVYDEYRFYNDIPLYHKLVSRCKKCGYIKIDKI